MSAIADCDVFAKGRGTFAKDKSAATSSYVYENVKIGIRSET